MAYPGPHPWLIGLRGDIDFTVAELVRYGAPRDFLEQFTDERADILSANVQTATDLMLSWFGDSIASPLLTWGADVRARTAHVVVYLLKSIVGMAPFDAAVGDENIRARYLDAEEWARGVGRGDLVAQGLTHSGGSDGAPLISGYPTGDPLRGW